MARHKPILVVLVKGTEINQYLGILPSHLLFNYCNTFDAKWECENVFFFLEISGG